MEFQIERFRVTEQDVASTVKLMADCFPKSTNLFSHEYLKWLYEKNPAGPAVGHNAFTTAHGLVGHYATIPVEAIIDGKLELGLLSLNTATHPIARGKGLFTLLAKKTFDTAKQEGFQFVVGVANQNSTPGFRKNLGFQVVSPLDVKIGFGTPSIDQSKEHMPRFSIARNVEYYQWRLARPDNSYKIYKDQGSLFSPTHIPFINVYLGCVESQFIKNINLPKKSTSIFPNIWIGLDSQISWRSKWYFNIPDKFKPSPLNFIFLDLSNKERKLSVNDIKFDALGFDAY